MPMSLRPELPESLYTSFSPRCRKAAAYSAGQLDTTLSLISGSIRTGRSIEVKQQLVKTIVKSWSQITGQPLAQVVAGVTEIEPEMIMEYGLFLPRPGDETEWFSANKDTLHGIHGAGQS